MRVHVLTVSRLSFWLTCASDKRSLAEKLPKCRQKRGVLRVCGFFGACGAGGAAATRIRKSKHRSTGGKSSNKPKIGSYFRR